MEKVILTTFTDPMMGLSYESEPIMDRLQKEYGDIIEFRNVMTLLVRDVSDFMTPEERAMKPEDGISLIFHDSSSDFHLLSGCSFSYNPSMKTRMTLNMEQYKLMLSRGYSEELCDAIVKNLNTAFVAKHMRSKVC